MTLDLARRGSASRAARAILVIGLCAGVLATLLAVGWLRDGLRHGCWTAVAGGRVEWHCTDDLALVGPSAAIVASGAFTLLAAAAVVRRTSARRAGAAAAAGLALLAAAPTAAVCLLLLRDAVVQDAAAPVAPSRFELWTAHALPALLVTVAACAVAAVGLGKRARGHGGRLTGALVLGSLAMMLAGAALAMMGTLSTSLVAASIIAAGWRIVAVVPAQQSPQVPAEPGAAAAPAVGAER